MSKDHVIKRGVLFFINTPQEVIDILLSLADSDTRIRINYGDPATGLDDLEEWGIIGYLTKTADGHLVLRYRRNSSTIYNIYDKDIIKLRESKTGKVLYQHPKYRMPELQLVPLSDKEKQQNRSNPHTTGIYTHQIVVDGRVHGRFESKKEAEKWLKKMIK